jgi:hypothetical protein
MRLDIRTDGQFPRDFRQDQYGTLGHELARVSCWVGSDRRSRIHGLAEAFMIGLFNHPIGICFRPPGWRPPDETGTGVSPTVSHSQETHHERSAGLSDVW